jgi:hypothetical protein
MPATHESVGNDFSFHPATDITAELHDATRQKFANMAHWTIDNVPDGEARNECVNRLREAMMWANAAIACDTNKIGDTSSD